MGDSVGGDKQVLRFPASTDPLRSGPDGEHQYVDSRQTRSDSAVHDTPHEVLGGQGGPVADPRIVDDQRLLVGHFPSHARLASEISLTVRIAQQHPNTQHTRVVPLRRLHVGAEGTDVSVIVEPGAGLAIRSPMEQIIHVPPTGDSDPLRFVFSANEIDLHRLHVTAWAGGTFLAELEFQVSVTVSGPHAGTQVKSAEIESVRPESGEVTLQVRSDGGRYTFQLLSDVQLFDPVIVESISSGPDATTEQIIDTLRQLARRTSGYNADIVRRLMQNTGIALWNSLVPEAIREQFWQVRSGITTFSIATGLDTVPWELLYPITKTQDEGFLIEQVPVTRRVYNQARSRRINIGNARFVIPPGSPSNAATEITSLYRIMSGEGEPELVTDLTDLLQLLDAGDLGLTHFACHNSYKPGATGSSIAMGDGDFVPTLLERAKATEALASSHPLVFINACRSAGAVPHYTRMMGWAQQFLAAGAGAFVGTLWDVRSASAQTFAEVFYGQLMEGKTLGRASLHARRVAALNHDDPTWLAYSVYGDPNAVPGR
ncbi:CHAT domain-containing protein [Actinoplanes sp. ATCC 53533]|uniref:CHAT domain-containing protein n=1 Tax=Actinoplanes sp. ATCC 53533 TaxID=1288362 RepID=UPI003513C9DA